MPKLTDRELDNAAAGSQAGSNSYCFLSPRQTRRLSFRGDQISERATGSQAHGKSCQRGKTYHPLRENRK